MRFVGRAFLYLFFLGLLVGVAGLGVVGWAFWHYGQGLPDYKQLADYEPPTSTRVHAGDGRLLAEFAVESRVFVPIDAIPKRVSEGFIAAEDQNFYKHLASIFRRLSGLSSPILSTSLRVAVWLERLLSRSRWQKTSC